MKEIADFLNHNWVGTVIGVATFIIGLIIALWLKPRTRLAARIDSLDLVGPNAVLPTAIEFLFRGNKVPKVSLSRIALWNIGNTTIKGSEIVSTDPLRVVVSENGRILETSVLVRTRQVNDVECVSRANSEREAECRFDFLDPGDGALIQVIHTGTNKLDVLGTIRGMPKGVLRVDSPHKEKPAEARELPPIAAKVLAVLIGFGGLVVSGVALRDKEDWPSVVAGVFLIAIAVTLLFGTARMPPSGISPQITSDQPRKSWWKRGA